MSWFKKKPNFGFSIRKREAPDGLWLKCENCSEMLYARELERALRVCDKCGHHFKIRCTDYVTLLADPDSFAEMFAGVVAVDPLNFRDSKRYTDRLKDYRKRTQLEESVLTGAAQLAGHRIGLGVMDFAFMGGTLGSATGERLKRLIDWCTEAPCPLVLVSTSGGARMQEGILSLMQMAKTSVALAHLRAARQPFISILLNPTTAGVAASYASLGDVIIAEPRAQIGFAGPRVIQQTINQDLPEGFQTAEFVLEHGMIDMIVPRSEMRDTVGRVLDMLLVPQRTIELETAAVNGDRPPADAAGTDVAAGDSTEPAPLGDGEVPQAESSTPE